MWMGLSVIYVAELDILFIMHSTTFPKPYNNNNKINNVYLAKAIQRNYTYTDINHKFYR